MRSSFGFRSAAIATAVTLGAACAKAPDASTTTVTSAPADVDTGPCVCRLPQDEFLSCCRGGVELTCRCAGAGSDSACHVVPSGRRCGGASSR